jgi:hypothetical protein
MQKYLLSKELFNLITIQDVKGTKMGGIRTRRWTAEIDGGPPKQAKRDAMNAIPADITRSKIQIDVKCSIRVRSRG